MKRLSLILACAAIIGAAIVAQGQNLQNGNKKSSTLKTETASPAMKQNDPNKVGQPVKNGTAKNPRVKVIAKKAVAKRVTEVK